MTVAQWAEAVAIEAYGFCGLRPGEFWALTVPEFQDLMDAASWREARYRKVLEGAILKLLMPYMKERVDIRWELDGIFGGDPEQKVIEARNRRLRDMSASNG